jgi:hypothetical protein
MLHDITADAPSFQLINFLFGCLLIPFSRCQLLSSHYFTCFWYLHGIQYHGMIVFGVLGLVPVLEQFK